MLLLTKFMMRLTTQKANKTFVDTLERKHKPIKSTFYALKFLYPQLVFVSPILASGDVFVNLCCTDSFRPHKVTYDNKIVYKC